MPVIGFLHVDAITLITYVTQDRHIPTQLATDPDAARRVRVNTAAKC
jgi:hypothetical protein